MEKSILSLLMKEDSIMRELNFNCEKAEEWKAEYEKEFSSKYVKDRYDTYMSESSRLRAELSECRNELRDHIKMIISE